MSRFFSSRITTHTKNITLFLPLVVIGFLYNPMQVLAEVLVTTDPALIESFQSGNQVLDFDEITVPPAPSPCFILLDPNEYLSEGIIISATADGSDQTHVARLPGCGGFGNAGSLPNIIGGGTSPNTGWRETIRFDFPSETQAIGAQTDGSGSRTMLTAYDSIGNIIDSVSGNEGQFMGISAPGISFALWEWVSDQGAHGFSLDNVTFTAPDDHVTPVPDTVVLAAILLNQNVPNPFNPSTLISYELENDGPMKLEVFDVAGRLVKVLAHENQSKGRHQLTWYGRNKDGQMAATGVYYYRLSADGESQTRRMLLVK